VTRRTFVVALAATIGGLGVWAGWLQVAEPVATAEALGQSLWGVAVAGVAGLALLGGGRAIRGLVAGPGQRPPGDWLHDAVVGHLVATALLFVLGLLGLLGPWTAAAVGGLLLAGWAVPVARGSHRSRLPTWSPVVGAVVVILLLSAGFGALAPPVDTDELYWHLAVPARILREGTLAGGWLDPVAARPLPLQLHYAALLATGGEVAAKAFHVLVAGAVLLGLFEVVRGHAEVGSGGAGPAWAVLLVVGSWTFLDEVGLAHDNLPCALLVLAALDAALRGARWRLGLAVGAALALKYTAAPALLGVVLVFATVRARIGWRALGELALVGVVAAMVVAPWWLRNAASGLHPLFPYVGWPAAEGFTFAYPAKYGVGHGLIDLLRLPWDLVFRAETTSYVYLGRLHPAWLLFAPAAVWVGLWERRVRVLLLATAVGLVGWFLGAQWMRHLLPLAPVVAVGWGLAMVRLPPEVARVSVLVWVLLLPPQVIDIPKRVADAAEVVAGTEAREQWLARHRPAWEAIDWVNRHAPEGARVALLFAGDTYLVDRSVLLGSVEDHTPVRHLLWSRGDQALAALREAGVGYLVVGRASFLGHTYDFLDESVLREQFVEPRDGLEDLLSREATLVFEGGGHAVWALGLDEVEARQ